MERATVVFFSWLFATTLLGILYFSIPEPSPAQQCFSYGVEVNCSTIIMPLEPEPTFKLFYNVSLTVDQPRDTSKSDDATNQERH